MSISPLQLAIQIAANIPYDVAPPKYVDGLVADQLVQIINAPPHKLAEVLSKIWFEALEQYTKSLSYFAHEGRDRYYVNLIEKIAWKIHKKMAMKGPNLFNMMCNDTAAVLGISVPNVDANSGKGNGVLVEMAHAFDDLLNAAADKFSAPSHDKSENAILVADSVSAATEPNYQVEKDSFSATAEASVNSVNSSMVSQAPDIGDL